MELKALTFTLVFRALMGDIFASPSQPKPLELSVDVWMDHWRRVFSKAVTRGELGVLHVGAGEFLPPRPVCNPSAVLTCHQPRSKLQARDVCSGKWHQPQGELGGF